MAWTHCLAALLLAAPSLAQSPPLRVFLRGGPKTHGPGQHEHELFVGEWKKLLGERGAVVDGALRFPSADELARTDVLVMYAAEGGSIHGEERASLERYLARGGGIVVLHDAVCGDDAQWFKTVVGGAWEHGHSKWHEGTVDLYLTDVEHPITAGAANFRFEDEIYFDLHVVPEAKVLAQGFHSVFDITPQTWTYEKDGYRAFVSIQGHEWTSFAHPAWRALVLRGIAWAGKRDVDLLLKPGEAAALRYPPGGPTAPEKARELIDLHPDFELSLVAAEPLVVKPIAVDWDARGRMWVAMTPGYPEKERFSGKPARDEVAILLDRDGDGRMDERKTFAGGLDLVTSFVFHRDGVIVSQAPDILFLRDTDGDDTCDAREIVFTGFGFGDTHAVMSSFRRGPDGWIYATQGYSGGASNHVTNAAGRDFGKIGNGLFRFRPDGSAIEMVSSYRDNTWGCSFSPDGELFFTMANGAHLRHVVVPEALLDGNRVDNVASWSDLPDHDRVVPAIVHEDAPYAQIDFVGGFTAASGSCFYDGGAWPSEWSSSHFVCEPTVHIVHHDVIEPKGVSFTARKAREAEFIAGRDLWFRPVDVRVGPDGALYVLDFYNQAVVHNDTRGPTHGPTNAAIRPDRDHEHGRIWRVQHERATAPSRAVASLETPERQRLLDLRAQSERPLTTEFAAQLVALWPKLDDPWTKSLAVRCAAEDVTKLVQAARADQGGASELVAHATRAAVRRQGLATASAAVAAVAVDTVDDAIRLAVVEAVAGEAKPVEQGGDEHTKASLAFLLACVDERTAVAALPLVSRWKLDAELAPAVARLAERLAARLADPDAEIGARIAALAALISIPSARTSAIEAADTLLSVTDARVQLATVDVLGRTDDPSAGHSLAEAYPWLSVEARDRAFELLAARAVWSDEMLDRIEEQVIELADLGPQKLHRLRNHPNAQISARATVLFEALAGGANAAIDELVAKLLPEVDQPGDRAHGKEVFTQNCSTCHTAFGEGAKVGPDLSGMGAHGARDLLPIILDPNRVVEASYAEWVVTTVDERNFAGVLVRESKDSVLLRSSSGDAEVAREDIVEMRNTGRSPMPAGLETLGAAALRDVIAYLAGDYAGWRVLDLKRVVTSSSLAGLYDTKRDAKPLKFARYGVVDVAGTPFEILDPRRTDSGCNAVVLRGGLVGDWESKIARPQRVEVRVGCAPERVHVLGGIGGWAYPYVKDQKPVVKWTWRFADGTSEVVELRNGVEFADWIGRFDVPGSELVEGVLAEDSWGQMRRFSVAPREKKVVESIVLESYDNEIAPTLIALTAELPGAQKTTPASAPATARIVLVGGGSSHDFERWFDRADRETLREISGGDLLYAGTTTHMVERLAGAEVLVLSTNQPIAPDDRRAMVEFVERGGGLVLLHAATWRNWPDWSEHEDLAGGGASSHEPYGEIEVTLVDADLPLCTSVPQRFRISDELYRFETKVGAPPVACQAKGRSLATGEAYPVLCVLARGAGRIVVLTLGHDGAAHEHPAFKQLLNNAVRWSTGSR